MVTGKMDAWELPWKPGAKPSGVVNSDGSDISEPQFYYGSIGSSQITWRSSSN